MTGSLCGMDLFCGWRYGCGDQRLGSNAPEIGTDDETVTPVPSLTIKKERKKEGKKERSKQRNKERKKK